MQQNVSNFVSPLSYFHNYQTVARKTLYSLKNTLRRSIIIMGAPEGGPTPPGFGNLTLSY